MARKNRRMSWRANTFSMSSTKRNPHRCNAGRRWSSLVLHELMLCDGGVLRLVGQLGARAGVGIPGLTLTWRVSKASSRRGRVPGSVSIPLAQGESSRVGLLGDHSGGALLSEEAHSPHEPADCHFGQPANARREQRAA